LLTQSATYPKANIIKQLITSLSPEDDAWFEVERAGIRHGVSGDCSD
jgi:hypothetical protein